MPTQEQVDQTIESLLNRNADPRTDENYRLMVRHVVIDLATEQNIDIDIASSDQIRSLLNSVIEFIGSIGAGVYGVRTEEQIDERTSNIDLVDELTTRLRNDIEFRNQYEQEHVRERVVELEAASHEIAENFIRQTRASLRGEGISAPPKSPRNRNRLI